MTNQFINW